MLVYILMHQGIIFKIFYEKDISKEGMLKSHREYSIQIIYHVFLYNIDTIK